MKFNNVPDGYIPGSDRSENEHKRVTHLYKGTFNDPGLPMCRNGWNRDNGESYSILRNSVSKKGICRICLARANQGADGVSCNQ